MRRCISIALAMLMLFAVLVSAQAQTETETETQTERRTQRRGSSDPRQNPDGTLNPETAPEVGEELLEKERIPSGLDGPINPDTYVIGPGDRFLVYVKTGTSLTVPLTVLPGGNVLAPNIGPIRAAGLTITEFEESLQKIVGRNYRDVQIHCELTVPRTFIAYVLGEVENPGAIQMRAPFRLDSALRAAGGITERGSRRMVEIRSDSSLVRTADLVSFLRMGNLDQNPILNEGQRVFVPSRRPWCTIIGEVWNGGVIEVLPGETIQDMIDLAGGLTEYAAMDRVMLERMTDNEVLNVNHLVEAEVPGTPVEGRDVVVIPDIRTFPGTISVRVEGGRGREGRIYIEEGETIGEFINRWVRLREDHDLEKAVVERKTSEGDVEFIPVDLTRVISGEDDGSLELLPGDVISVPLVDNFVYVTGEVTAPGQVSFQRGLPASRYIALAGGPSSRGSMDRLRIYDSNGNERKGNRSALVYRGETILVKPRKSVIFGTLFFGFTSLAGLIIAVIALANSSN